MKTSKIITLAMAVAVVACQVEIDAPTPHEEIPAGANLVPMTFSAAGEDTKTTIDGVSVNWTEGDAITVFGSDSQPYASDPLTSGGASATFTVSLPEGTTDPYAVYPANDAASINGNEISTVIPAAQTVPAGGVVDPAALVSVAKASGETLAFKNAFSLVSITIDEDNVKGITLSATAGEAISGPVAITVGSAPTATVSGSASEITLSHESGVFPQGTYFIATAPGVTLTKGLTIMLDKTQSAGFRQAGSQITLARNNGSDAGVSSEFPTGFAIRSGSDLKAWHDDDDAVRTNMNALLLADIDVNEAMGGNWTPVDFDNNFYGFGHKLYNIQIVRGEASYPGFIGTLKGNISNVVFGSQDGTSYDGTSSLTVDAAATSLRAGIIGNSGTPADTETTRTWKNIVSFVPVTIASGYSGLVYAGGILGAMDDSKSGVNLTGCKSYGKITVSGCKNGSSIGGLYGRSNKAVTIEDCTNYGDVEISTSTDITSETFFGGIVGYHNQATMKRVTNEGNVTVAATGGPLKIGGIAGSLATATLTNVENKGNVTSDSASGLQYVGGLIGYGVNNVNLVIGQDEGTKCINRGAVSISDQASSVTNNSCVGGIIAYTYHTAAAPSKVSIAYAENYGAVKMAGGFVAGGTYSVGGICGYCYAPTVASCLNTGKISVESGSAISCITDLAGIIGSQRTTTVSACRNEGDVYATGISGSIRAGGIAGRMCEAVNAIQDDEAGNHSTNSGKIWTAYTGAETSVWVAFGGIAGFTDVGANHTITNAVNSGEVYCQMKRNGGYTQAGGIVGRANTFDVISGCTNTGTITSDNQADANGNCYAGGIVGNTPSANTSYANAVSGCTNEGTVTAISKTRTNTGLGAGGIIGWAYANISGCTNKGNINSKNNNYAGSICGIGRDNTLTGNTMYASGLLNGNVPTKPTDGKGLASNEKGIYGVSYSNTTTVSGTTYFE